jgi:type IV pilus assembly protein PilN
VKPLHLNLASRPYRDYRPVYAAVVLMSLLAAFLMLNNVETYYRYNRDTRSTRAKIARIEAQTQQEREREASVQQRIKGLDLGRLGAQTKFVNAKLSERAFSWSTLLDELESVLADDVRLLSVAPRFGTDGTIQLNLDFVSKSSDGMIKTINRMHADPQFRNPFPSSQTQLEGDQGFTFSLTVQYLVPPMSGGVPLSEAPR